MVHKWLGQKWLADFNTENKRTGLIKPLVEIRCLFAATVSPATDSNYLKVLHIYNTAQHFMGTVVALTKVTMQNTSYSIGLNVRVNGGIQFLKIQKMGLSTPFNIIKIIAVIFVSAYTEKTNYTFFSMKL